ncbi:MAG: riboflavin synthase [Phycisphaerales bacterium]|nr:riboflavin synthase [Phycisphaerales bacterium]
MFTGLIQAVGTVSATTPLTPVPKGLRLVIDPGSFNHQPALGDSIAVSGCCLTIADHPQPRAWAFDVIPESLAKTNLGLLKPGSKVNLEHALTPTTYLGGHFVQGHVDGQVSVAHLQTGDDWRVWLHLSEPSPDAPADDLWPCIIPKGSVTLDGTSLTIASVHRQPFQVAGTHLPGRCFSVALIPTTLEKTTLASWRVGSKVNFEADMLAKTVMNVVRNMGLPTGGLGGLGGLGGHSS